MTKRRAATWVVGLGLLAGCDRAAQAELAAGRMELVATTQVVKAQQQKIEALTAELERARAERQACERAAGLLSAPDSIPPPVIGPPGELPTVTPVCADGVCVVKRGEFEALMAAPEGVARLVRVVPAMKDGKPDGLKLFAIRPSSLLAALGFKNGDVVRTIAGADVSSMEATLEAYTKLRKLDRWTIAGTRKGAPFEVTIAIEG